MDTLTLQNNDIFVTPVASSMKFNCAYPDSIQVSSDGLTISGAAASGQAIKTGNLKSGFSLDLYTDPAQTIPTGSTNVYIGQPVYGDMTWSVTTAQTMINFYLDDCDLVDSGAVIKFVRDNCYSRTLGATQRQEAKIVSSTSKFSFIAFTVGTGDRYEMHSTITCKVRLCIATDSACAAALSQTDDDCDGESDAVAYQYKAVTWSSNR